MPTYIDHSQGQFGEEDFPGSIRRATKRDGVGLPWIASTPGGSEKRFRSPSSAWRWLRSLRKKRRGQPNTTKRLDWVYRTFPAPVYVETAAWVVVMGNFGPAITGVREELNDGLFGHLTLRSTPEQAEELKLRLGLALGAGEKTPLDRYVPWIASWINKYYKTVEKERKKPGGSARALVARFPERTFPRRTRVKRAFLDWLQTRPNLQGVQPVEAYERAMDWEENQLEERTYRKAKERLAKGGIGHTVMRAGGWTVREIGSKKTIPPWGSWDTGVLKNPGRGGPGVNLEELTVVGRALGHCYQKGALQQSYAANIVKGRLGLLSIFSPDGMPVATMSVNIDFNWPTWSDGTPKTWRQRVESSKTPRISISEFRGPRNQPVVASNPAMDKGVLALANKLFGTRFRSLPRLLALLPDSRTGELFFGLFGQQEAWKKGPQASPSPFTQYLFAPVRKRTPSEDDFKQTPGSGWHDEPPAWSDVKERSSGLEETLADPDWVLESNYESLTTPTMRLIGAISDAQQKDRKPWDRNGFLVELFTRKGRKSIVLTPEVAGGRLDEAYDLVVDSFAAWQQELARHRGEEPIVDQATDRVGPHPVQQAFFNAFDAASGQAYREIFGTYRKVKGKARLYKPGSSFLTLSWTGELGPSEGRRFESALDSFLRNVDDDGPFQDYIELTKVLFDRRITPMLERFARRR